MPIARIALTLTVLAATAGPASAQSADPSAADVFSALQGTWVGEGTLMGRSAAFEMEWAHRGAFASLHFSNAFASPDGPATPVLQAAAVYRTSPEDARGAWLDSRGVRFELAWTATDSALVVEWRGDQESGRTTYRVRGPGRLETVDEVGVDGGWREFARATFTPAGGNP